MTASALPPPQPHETWHEYRLELVGHLPNGRHVRRGFADLWERTEEFVIARAKELLGERYDPTTIWSVISIECIR